jgi:hypothetical protein
MLVWDYVSLTVEKLPFANTVTIPRQCDDNQDGIYTFNTATLRRYWMVKLM